LETGHVCVSGLENGVQSPAAATVEVDDCLFVALVTDGRSGRLAGNDEALLMKARRRLG